MASPAVLRPGLLEGRRALVTGAGTGIGRAISVRLCSLGASVVGIGRRAEPLAETAALCGSAFSWHAVNIRDRPSPESLVDGPIQLLVNNAGGQFVAPTAAITPRGFASVWDLNLTALAALTLAARPGLAATGGAVVNISLSGAEGGVPGLAHSAAARSGVIGLTRALARQWRSDGITVNCVAPGTVLTDGVRDELTPEQLAAVLAATPLGRATTVDEVAELVAFLASPSARAITGQLFTLDGGSALSGAASALRG